MNEDKQYVSSINDIDNYTKMCEYCCSTDLSYVIYYDAYQDCKFIDVVCNNCNLIVERIGACIDLRS